jgi:hypothetical protein
MSHSAWAERVGDMCRSYVAFLRKGVQCECSAALPQLLLQPDSRRVAAAPSAKRAASIDLTDDGQAAAAR